MKFTIIFNNGKTSEILEGVERFVLESNSESTQSEVEMAVHFQNGSTLYFENVLLIDVST